MNAEEGSWWKRSHFRWACRWGSAYKKKPIGLADEIAGRLFETSQKFEITLSIKAAENKKKFRDKNLPDVGDQFLQGQPFAQQAWPEGKCL